MSAVLELENRAIRDIYSFIFPFTIVIILEALITEALVTTTLPIFLIGSTIGYSLFWLTEFVAWRFILLGKTKQTKYVQGVIFFCRYTVLGGLLYFLFASVDIVYVWLTCIVYFGSTWFGSKEDDAKRVMFDVASDGLIVVLGLCIGYFVGKWIGGKLGYAEIGSYIGLALGIGLAFGFVAAFVRLRKKQRREETQKAQDTKADKLLRLNNDSPLL